MCCSYSSVSGKDGIEKHSRRSRRRSNCTWPFGWVSRRSYLSTRLRILSSILQIVSFGKLMFWLGFFCENQCSKVCFGVKSFVLGQKLAKLQKEEDRGSQRWDQPRQRWSQCKFLHIGGFNFFWHVAKSFSDFDRAKMERKKKERTKEKKHRGQKQREKVSITFHRASSLEKEMDDCLHLMRRLSHACSRRRGSFLASFDCECLKALLGFKGLSKSCTMSEAVKMALSFNLCVMMLFLFAQWRPHGRWRRSSNLFFFSLEDLGYEEPATEARRALAWSLFFSLRTIFFSQSDRKIIESK